MLKMWWFPFSFGHRHGRWIWLLLLPNASFVWSDETLWLLGFTAVMLRGYLWRQHIIGHFTVEWCHMGIMASEITGNLTVYSIAFSVWQQWQHQSSPVLALCATVLVIFLFFTWSWWCHQMETFSALLSICAGISIVTGEFSAQRPVTRSFDVFFDLCLNKRLSKQSWGWLFETLSCPLWRHCNDAAT